MRGDITLCLLEGIKDAAAETIDLFSAIINAGYGASYGRIEYEKAKAKLERAETREMILREQKTWRRYQKLLSGLKRDGLIQEQNSKKGRRFSITRAGRTKLAALRKQKTKELPAKIFLGEKSSAATIVIFDIPEKERRKREWLREAVRLLGFRMVQKSVWVGKVKIPKALVKELRNLNLTPFVEIFEVTRMGSLEKIVS